VDIVCHVERRGLGVRDEILVGHSRCSRARDMHRHHAIIAILGFVGCVPATHVVSSRTVLGPELSEVVVGMDPQPIALDLVRSLTLRGFALDDVQRDGNGSVTLHLKGQRRTTLEQTNPTLDAIVDVADALEGKGKYHPHEVAEVTYGSAFYVRIEPRGPGQAWVSIVGRTIRDGVELCTDDAPVIGPCVTNEDALTERPGHAEADVVNGVFAELRLRNVVVSPDPRPAMVARIDREQCEKYRADQIALANRVDNPRAKAAILGAMPKTCESPQAAAR
jgi:hypothetical protein